jgi:hypothetical protein
MLLKSKKLGEDTKQEKKSKFINHQKTKKSSLKMNRKLKKLNQITQIRINLITLESQKSNILTMKWKIFKNKKMIIKN